MKRAVQSEGDFIDHETSAHSAKADLRLWLRLLSCVTMIETGVRTRLRTSFETTLPRFDYLAALYKSETPLTMGDLSKRLMVSNGNITGVTDRLAEEGLIVRQRSESDKRAQYVALTAAGRAAFERMAQRHEGWISEAFADLSESDIQTLMRLLAKLKRSVRNRLGDEEAS